MKMLGKKIVLLADLAYHLCISRIIYAINNHHSKVMEKSIKKKKSMKNTK